VRNHNAEWALGSHYLNEPAGGVTANHNNFALVWSAAILLAHEIFPRTANFIG
jgi:hypothetical protein